MPDLPPGARPQELDRLHRQGSLALLQSEARLGQALAAGGAAAVQGGTVPERRRLLEVATTGIVLAGRQRSREAAVETLQPQIALAAEVNPALPALLEVTAEGYDYDRVRAAAVALSLADRWGRKLEDFVADGLPVGPAAELAFEQLARDPDPDKVSRLEIIAATEAAEAFDQQREDDLDAYGRSVAYQAETRREFAAVPFKWWNAVLDKRTCRTCSVAHGKIVLLGQPFPEGRPGGVHPSCRCVADIVLLPAWYRRYERALEAAA
jgi:uncharacterized protein with gpF-like domain